MVFQPQNTQPQDFSSQPQNRKTLFSGWKILGHAPVGKCFITYQSFLLIILQYQPTSSQYSWPSIKQPIRFRLSVVFASLGISKAIDDISNVHMIIWAYILFLLGPCVIFTLGMCDLWLKLDDFHFGHEWFLHYACVISDEIRLFLLLTCVIFTLGM